MNKKNIFVKASFFILGNVITLQSFGLGIYLQNNDPNLCMFVSATLASKDKNLSVPAGSLGYIDYYSDLGLNPGVNPPHQVAVWITQYDQGPVCGGNSKIFGTYTLTVYQDGTASSKSEGCVTGDCSKITFGTYNDGYNPFNPLYSISK